MRILVDTNILISAVWHEDSHIGKVLKYISQSEKYTLYLTDQNIAEFKEAVERKMPDRRAFVDILLSKLNYEVITAVSNNDKTIRDPKDQPILNAAIIEGLDVILTGDKDFLSLNLDLPKPMTITDFCKQEGIA